MNAINIFENQGMTEVSPLEAGFDPDSLGYLDEYLKENIQTGKLQGACYILSRKGKVFARKSMGTQHYKTPEVPFTTNSIRRLYSLTKPFTAAAIMQLVERGKLYLKQPMKHFIPELDTSEHGGINIFHCLSHTSGLNPDPGYYNEAYPLELRNNDLSKDPDWIKKMITGALRSNPGETWLYSSIAFVLLGEVIRKITGLSYEEYMHENIFRPLGMNRTHFIIPEELRDDLSLVSEDEEECFQTTQRENNYYASTMDLCSTADDLWKFSQMMLNGGTLNGKKVLSRKSVALMTRNNLQNVPGAGPCTKPVEHGLGWFVNPRGLMSKGSFLYEGMLRCLIAIDPSEDLVAILQVPSSTLYFPASTTVPVNIIWGGLL